MQNIQASDFFDDLRRNAWLLRFFWSHPRDIISSTANIVSRSTKRARIPTTRPASTRELYAGHANRHR
jgi:hypothetical protein